MFSIRFSVSHCMHDRIYFQPTPQKSAILWRSKTVLILKICAELRELFANYIFLKTASATPLFCIWSLNSWNGTLTVNNYKNKLNKVYKIAPTQKVEHIEYLFIFLYIRHRFWDVLQLFEDKVKIGIKLHVKRVSKASNEIWKVF